MGGGFEFAYLTHRDEVHTYIPDDADLSGRIVVSRVAGGSIHYARRIMSRQRN